MNNINRRQALSLGVGAGAFLAFAGQVRPTFAATKTEEAITTFTGGAEVSEGKVKLTTPEIAENGNTVPISVSVDSPMTDADHVTSVAIYADGNPLPNVVTFNFTPASGVAQAKTRIRLAKTQNVVAVAKMSDGSFQMAKNQVKVTIGGCGG